MKREGSGNHQHSYRLANHLQVCYLSRVYKKKQSARQFGQGMKVRLRNVLLTLTCNIHFINSPSSSEK